MISTFLKISSIWLLWIMGVSLPLSGQTRASARAADEAGIPVTDPVVIAKCGGCHKSDEQKNMDRISWQRGTPEAWQEVLRSMVQRNGLSLAPDEARSVV